MFFNIWNNVTKDYLSLYFVFLISIITIPIFIYSKGYMKEYKKNYSINYFVVIMLLFVFSMVGVVLSSNSIAFIVFWELMSASSFLLVIYEYKVKENLKSGMIYFIMTHISGLFIMGMFGMLYKYTGTMNFSVIAEKAPLINTSKTYIVLILALLGFGAKAGLVPLHAWLPKAHPSAPSNISSLMSGVMLKIALYGFIRVAFIFVKTAPLGFGIGVMVIGALSAIFAAINGLFQEDIKKLLAYSSAENIGIIFSTLGLSMIFNFYGLNSLGLLSLTAALFHILNHAVFKSLLFTGAGSVLYGTSTRNMNELGGLYHKMKFTAVCVFIGTAAIGAIPPLNGFASEILILKSFIHGGLSIKNPEIMFITFFCGVALAVTSGFVLWSAVKSFGITFLGAPRSVKAKEVHKIPLSMNIGMGILSAYAIIFGVLSPFAVNIISKLSNSIRGLSVDISGITLGYEITIAAIIFGFILLLVLLGSKLTSKTEVVEYNETWGCGFNNPKPYMQYSGSGFSQPGTRLVGSFVGYDKEVRIKNNIFLRQKYSDVIEKYLYKNIVKFFEFISEKIVKLHYGKIQAYISYIFISLIVAIVLVLKFV